MTVGPILKLDLDKLKKYFLPEVKEVVINKPGEVLYETVDGKWITKKDKNLNLRWAEEFAQEMASFSGQKFGKNHPILSFKIPTFGTRAEEKGGHRVQIFHGDICQSRFAMAIRLHRDVTFSLDNFCLSREDKDTIVDLVKNKKTLLISGGTGTGKTSFLNTLLEFIPKTERLITIEGVSELKVPHNNKVSLIYSENDTSVDNKGVAALLNSTLRARPDRIILGELRKENSYVFLRAINTGHEGSLATIHANNPKQAILALVDNMIMNGDISEDAVVTCRNRLLHDVAAVVQMKREEGGKISAYVERTSDIHYDH